MRLSQPNIQVLYAFNWRVTMKFNDLRAIRLHVNRQIREHDYTIQSVSLFHNQDYSGVMTLFLSNNGALKCTTIAECPFASITLMERTLRRWRSVGRPEVVVFKSDGNGKYIKQVPNTWRW